MDVPSDGPVSSGQPDAPVAAAGEEAPGDAAETRNTAEKRVHGRGPRHARGL